MTHTSGSTDRLRQLLHQARERDDAFAELIQVASRRLMVLTRAMLRNYPRLRRWEQTEDVFQTAMLKLHRSLHEVRPDSLSSFFKLASTQIRRTLIDLARHYFGPAGLGARQVDVNEAPQIEPDDRGSHSQQPESLESWARFHEAFERLPEADRETAQLAWYAGLSQQEIAGILEISVPTVKRRWRRARLRLFELMAGEPPA